MSWETAGNLWDHCWIGDNHLPGVAVVTGGVGRALDIQKAKGADGFSTTDNGLEVDDLVLTLQFVASQMADVRKILAEITPKEGTKRAPYEILHEATNLLGIRTVDIKHVGIPTVSGGIGQVQITMVKHYADTPPVPKAAKKVSANAGLSDSVLLANSDDDEVLAS